MPTTYSPTKNEDFDSLSLMFKARGVKSTATAGTQTTLDHRVADDSILTGGYLLAHNATFGDTVTQQVVDVDGILAPAGTVLREFVLDWNISTTTDEQPWLIAGYPAKVFAGLYLRVIYTSTGATNVPFGVNYVLHKVLV